MTPQDSADDPPFLSTLAIGPVDKKMAFWILAASVLFFVLAAPYAKLQLAKVWAFIPIYESLVVTNDLITATLLFGQFRILKSRSLCVLACGYLFTACTAAIHALTFPGLFTDGGLLGAGPQSTAWLYMFWHAGLPLFAIAYALLKSEGSARRASDRRPFNAGGCVAATLALVVAFAWLACGGADYLPRIMNGNRYTPAMLTVVGGTWLMSALCVPVLYWRRPHSVLDLWLGVVMSVWLFDIALSAVLNGGRFDLGFYAGRIYGLIASGAVLLILLLENGRLYAQLVEAHGREHRKSLELAVANQELEAFSYSVSHDLRAPLRAIDGFGSLLLARLGAEADPTIRHYLDRIGSATRRMAALIDNLLNLSRISRSPLRPTRGDVSRIARDILAELAESDPDRKVEASVADGMEVSADPQLLAVLFQNLIGNAWKYTSRRPDARIEIGADTRQGERVFYVKDNGAGFDMSMAQNLFQPFQRLHAETEFPGTGIGLATVHRIVARHGGRIWADAAPGRGASFYFVLEAAT